jgi:hypothetical protein
MRTMIAALVVATLAGQASAKDQNFDWAAYPEMSQERALPQIAAALRDDLFDASPVTNFKICYPPVKVKMRDGRPVQWTVMLSLNAKNREGGYVGNQGMAAVFYSEKPVWVFSIDGPLTGKLAEGCQRIPDAEIQRLIGK